MQQVEMVIGKVYAVKFPSGEAQAARYGGAVVAATLIEKGATITSVYGRQKGVRLRLEAPLRALATRGTGEFVARDPGYSFAVPSRDVLRGWGEFDGRTNDDEAMQSQRERRYAGQDSLRRLFERLGAPGAALAGDEVTIDLHELLRWLNRIDPQPIAADAIDGFVEALDRNASGDWMTNRRALDIAKAQSLAEVAAGLAVTDEEIGLKDGYRTAAGSSEPGDAF